MELNLQGGDLVDRISNLPDAILVHILSSLETKEAVATSILSKRWEYLWTLTSCLDIDDSSLVDYEKENENDCTSKFRSFKDHVDRVIFYHSGSNLRKCYLFFRTKCITPYVYSWICCVITSHLQELYVLDRSYSRGLTFHQLPCRLFTCNTLVVLHISGTFVLDIPAYVCFPCLKFLKFRYSVFVDDASTERLFSSCPVLEELSIYRLMDFLKIMNISIPSLKRLHISSMGHSIQIVINTPCLEHLHILGDLPSRYSVIFPSSIVGARLGDGFDVSLLHGIIQVNHLVVRGTSKSLWNIVRDSYLPKFNKLVTMEFLVGRPSDCTLLPNLLQCSPNLKVLIIEVLASMTLVSRDANQFNLRQPESVPVCLGLHLKKIEILGFMGSREELHLVEYLLDSAQVLDKLIIHLDYLRRKLNMENKMEVDEVMSEVLSFKSCSSCEVNFTD